MYLALMKADKTIKKTPLDREVKINGYGRILLKHFKILLEYSYEKPRLEEVNLYYDLFIKDIGFISKFQFFRAVLVLNEYAKSNQQREK